MKDKGHFISSIVKSILRIFGYTFAGIAVTDPYLIIAVVLLIAAEILGIAEEFFDKRG